MNSRLKKLERAVPPPPPSLAVVYQDERGLYFDRPLYDAERREILPPFVADKVLVVIYEARNPVQMETGCNIYLPNNGR